MRTPGSLRVLGGAAAMTALGVAFAVPANAGQEVVNPARCAAQGGTYAAVGTSRACTVTTSADPQSALQFLDGPVTSPTATAAYIQLARVTDTTSTTTGPRTTTTSTSRVTGIAPGPVTCASGSVLDIVSHTATAVDCASVGLPDPNLNGPDPIFVLS
ncbi:MAG: hypothetical protein JWO22_2601 [Frankiales bacterium]|nr:hypothetical protein [Frankiales bacterium]